jgi:hypothetical protein
VYVQTVAALKVAESCRFAGLIREKVRVRDLELVKWVKLARRQRSEATMVVYSDAKRVLVWKGRNVVS